MRVSGARQMVAGAMGATDFLRALAAVIEMLVGDPTQSQPVPRCFPKARCAVWSP
jgi:hypothetical protein